MNRRTEKKCMKCGKKCSGKMCQKCYRMNRRGQLSRRKK